MSLEYIIKKKSLYQLERDLQRLEAKRQKILAAMRGKACPPCHVYKPRTLVVHVRHDELFVIFGD